MVNGLGVCFPLFFPANDVRKSLFETLRAWLLYFSAGAFKARVSQMLFCFFFFFDFRIQNELVLEDNRKVRRIVVLIFEDNKLYQSNCL